MVGIGVTIDENTLKALLKDVPDLFHNISLTIDHPICRLGECRLCLDKCPTNALYQKERVELIPELCNGCGGCVLVCMVPGCIQLTRTRNETGKQEVLSTPKEVEKSLRALNKRKKQKAGKIAFVDMLKDC